MATPNQDQLKFILKVEDRASRAFRRIAGELRDVGRAGAEARARMTGATDEMARSGERARQATRRYQQAEAALDAVGTSASATADAADDTSRSIGNTGARANAASQAFAALERNTVGLKSALVRLGVATGALAAPAVAAGGLGAVSVLATRAAARMNDLAQQANTNVEQFQKLQFAAGQLGVQERNLASGLQAVNQAAFEFVQGGGETVARTFRAIGLSQSEVQPLLNRNGELFRTIIRRVRELDSTAAQTRVLTNIFGENDGQAFLRLVRAGADRINELERAAVDLGIVLDDNTIRAAERANRVFKALWTTLRNQVIQAVAANAREIRHLAEDILARLPTIIDRVASAAEFLVRNFQAVVTVASTLAGMSLGSIFGPWGRAIGAVAGALASLLPRLYDWESNTRGVSDAVATLAQRSQLAGDALTGSLRPGLDDIVARMRRATRATREFNEATAEQAELKIARLQTRVRNLQKRRKDVLSEIADRVEQRSATLGQDEGGPLMGQSRTTQQLTAEIQRLDEREANLSQKIDQQQDALKRARAVMERYRENTRDTADDQRDLGNALSDSSGNARDWQDRLSELRRQTDGTSAAFDQMQDRIGFLNRLVNEGKIDWQQYSRLVEQVGDAYRRAAGEGDKASKALQRQNDQLADQQQRIQEISRSFADNFTSSVERAIVAGRDLQSTVQALLKDLARMSLRAGVFDPLERQFSSAATNVLQGDGGGIPDAQGAAPRRLSSPDSGGWISSALDFAGSLVGGLFAKGGAFDQGVRKLESGGLLDRPTMFGTRSGPAVAGEAGTEAVMPLTRMPSGDLGVKAAGGGSTVINNHVEVNVQGQPGQSEEQAREQGKVIGREVERIMDKKIDQRIAKQMRPGNMLNPTSQPI